MGEVIFDASEDQPDESKDGKDVAETSKEHYRDMIQSGELGRQKRKVLKGVSAQKVLPTIDELAHESLAGMEKSTISGRLNNLKDDGLVTDLSGDAKRESTYSGVTSKVWSVTDKGEKLLEEID